MLMTRKPKDCEGRKAITKQQIQSREEGPDNRKNDTTNITDA